MERLIGHAELQELLGAYALDAVEPEEAAAIERHLPTCPRCRNELADHREVAALLGYAGGSAPSGVWDRIIASLEEPPPALRLTRAPIADVVRPPAGTATPVEATPPNSWVRPFDAVAADPSPSDGELTGGPRTPPPVHARTLFLPPMSKGDDKVVPIGSGRGRKSVEWRLMAAVMAVAAVFVAALGIEVGRLQVRKPATQTANLASLAYHVADADSSATHLTLASADGVHTVRAVIIADGTTYLGPGNLDTLPPDETYQMWGIVNGARVSLGVFGDSPTFHTFTTPKSAAVIAMTVEQRGGVVSSTNTPVVTAVVPGA